MTAVRRHAIRLALALMFGLPLLSSAGDATDTITTSAGDLSLSFIGHGTLMMTCGGKILHIDPWSQLADYARLPKADIILVTHEHPDHLDVGAIKALRTERTDILVSPSSVNRIPGSQVISNGETRVVQGVRIEAVPAYNVVHQRAPEQPFHPKGFGNGYILTFGDKRVYVAGDTENTPEMKALKKIDVAFLSMNLPYTMTPEMVADAARAMKPTILYPYHTGETDVSVLVRLLEGSGIDVRIRDLH